VSRKERFPSKRPAMPFSSGPA